MSSEKAKKSLSKTSPASSTSAPAASCPFSLKSRKFAVVFGGTMNVLIAALAYCAYTQRFSGPSTEVVQTKLGAIEGKFGWSRDGRQFRQYLGIGYAQAPIGERRFEPPEPPLSWDGVLDAKCFKSGCLQVESFATGLTLGSEDCLYLNVFVSQFGRISKKPVMVYIHGGVFHVGGSEYSGAQYFMDEDVVLVTINYRLGSFGFLSTGDKVISGNMGLKDQRLALKWVQENIQYFGGDPTKVTIFGESAGGASVHHHLLSPASRGLFYRAIHQSGSSINYWAVYRNVKKQSERFARKLGCPVSTSRAIAKCLKSLDANKIVAVHKELMDNYRPQITTFVPTIEVSDAKDPFLTEEPKKMLEEGRFARIPLMTGVNANEGQLISKSLLASRTRLNKANSNWEQWAPWSLHYPEELTEVSRKLRHFYFGDVKEINDTRFFQNYTDLFGDRLFTTRGSVAARIEAKYTPTYLYYYDYSGSYNAGEFIASSKGDYLPPWLNTAIYMARKSILSLFRIYPKRSKGNACHSDETLMLFNRDYVQNIKQGHPDYQMSRDIVKLWVSFASNDPVIRFRNVEWHPVKTNSSEKGDDGVKYLSISEDPAMIPEPFQERRLFWESLNLPNL